MPTHVIVGAGAVGWHTALTLADRGHLVTIATRSGSGPVHESIKRVALNATNARALTKITQGAQALYNCANPPYHRWATDWPPLAQAMLATAERTGAGLVTMGNLYNYGRVHAPMTEQTPEAATGGKGRVRIGMYRDAMDAHQAGRIRATEARASDFFGPRTAKTSYLTMLVLPKVAGRKKVRMPVGDVDAPHSWTYIPDIAATLATLGTDDRSWGQLWHVPTAPPRSINQVIADAANLIGVEPRRASALPAPVLRLGGVWVPFLRELDETRHQFDHAWVLDSTKFQDAFAVQPTAWTTSLTESLELAQI